MYQPRIVEIGFNDNSSIDFGREEHLSSVTRLMVPKVPANIFHN